MVNTNYSQTKVAITIDDVPNINDSDNYSYKLLNKIDSLKIPVAIYINESKIYKTDKVSKNFDLLNQWAKNEYTTLGNHTFSHLRYSSSTLGDFKTDIIKGESITSELAKLHNKPLNHFRFPYNDLGADSLQQKQIYDFLKSKNYSISPFTIESSDWMFNRLYEHYLEKGDNKSAKKIANTYIETTLQYFNYFKKLSLLHYEREINQIYLCHDNRLNSDYLDLLISKLALSGYSYISLDQALSDEVYQKKNKYYKKWGISWIYRWMANKAARSKLMRSEPDMSETLKLYNSIQKNK